MSEGVTRSGGRVLLLQRRLTHYRVPFFEGLRAELARRGMSLTLGVGQATAAERLRDDAGTLPWATSVPSQQFAGGRAVWQTLGPLCAEADLMVLPQENRLLSNVPWLLRRSAQRVALWGHGQDLQAGPGLAAALAQAWKAALTRRADWWFAYTSTSADVFQSLGCPAQRISTVNNAVDTAGLAQAVDALRQRGLADAWAALGLRGEPGDGPVGLFLGSLAAGRRLDLLLAAVAQLRAAIPGFQWLIAGDGPETGWLRERVRGDDRVHLLGAVHGLRKQQCLAVADLVLMPAGLGLGLLDALACGVPLVTSHAPGHGPEFAYLQAGHNALVVDAQATALAQAAQSVLQQPDLAERLRQVGRETAAQHSLQAMVQRFADGLQAWSQAPRRGAAR